MSRAAAIAAEIPRLRRYARALIGDAVAADDLVQDCLLRALANQAAWREGASPRKWLFRILHNLHIDEARRRSRRPAEVELDHAEALSQPGQWQPPQAAFEITAALAVLPEDQRQALLLVTLEGFSYAETAQLLEVPVGTVMSRVSRGREKLRQILFTDDGRKSRLTRIK